MIPELGSFALTVALGLAVLLSIYPLLGAHWSNSKMLQTARPLSYSLFFMVLLAFICLTYGFISNDFSVIYIANNSNSQLPVYYRIAAVWGSHEGSLLLWVMLLAGWTAAVAGLSRTMPQQAVGRVLAVMGMINVGFLLFVIFTSNPFTRGLPLFPADGRDLNPLLQDIGLIFHPPLLYMGYVGFSVAFAFSIASLINGRLDTAWARWSRPWTLAAWCFLSLGILLGAGWAYYELGWGGWWFWDPVENASLMPWLTGTALIHSLASTEKRAVFKSWTILLAIATFSLCLMGTFLVRSGILVSVHAFAADATRGTFILVYLALVVGGSLLLYALNAGKMKSRVQFEFFSRENILLGNNLLLLAATLVVLLGTLLPLVHKQLGLGSISVGAPFFNSMFTWLMMPFALLLGVGPLVRWRRDHVSRLLKPLMLALFLALLLSIILPWLLVDKLLAYTILGLVMSFTVLILSLLELHQRASHRHTFLKGLTHLSASHWGMVVAHVGVAAMVFGITFSQNHSIERNVRMNVGDTVTLDQYRFTLNEITTRQGANYQATTGVITIDSARNSSIKLSAEKRQYTVSRMVMTEAAIDSNLRRDIYTALGEQVSDEGAWGVRLYYKPFMSWIWIGGLFMALGGVLCLFDPRYRQKVIE